MSSSLQDGRLHLRIPPELKEWAIKYALEKNTTVTGLVIRLLTEVRDAEELAKSRLDAEQV